MKTHPSHQRLIVIDDDRSNHEEFHAFDNAAESSEQGKLHFTVNDTSARLPKDIRTLSESCFEFTRPFSPCTMSMLAPSAADPKGFSPHLEWLRPIVSQGDLTALIVDDNAVNRRFASVLMRRLGFAVETATNGVEAVEICKRTRPNLVLMDCQMPEMDGFEATRRIRVQEASDRRRRVPIVAFTACVLDSDRDDCLNAGMDDFLAKPIVLSQLRHVVEGALQLPPNRVAEFKASPSRLSNAPCL